MKPFPPFSFPLLRTRELVLREITIADAEAYFALCSDAEVMRTFGIQRHETLEDTRNLIRFLDEGFRQGLSIRWGVELDGTLVGDVGFWRFVKERSRAEVGAKLARPHWRGGLMSQALSAVVAYGLEQMGLHSIEANVDPKNAGARRMVEKVGFVEEGYLREHSFCPYTGKYTDTVLYSILADGGKPT